MTTHVVLFTRDLRVHDHPALHAATGAADRVVPLFVFDDAILSSPYAAPNRVAFLLDCLEDLRGSLRDLGADLVLRRGDVADEVAAVVAATGADTVHLTAEVSAYGRRREQRLRDVLTEVRGDGATVEAHPGVTVHAAGAVAPTSGDFFKVFTPYWRRWVEAPVREVRPVPDGIVLPDDLDAGGDLPALGDLVEGDPSPELQRGGEARARARLDAWFAGPIEAYEEARNDLSAEGTSRLSADLHFGTISPVEVADRVDRRRRGHDGFLQELCWRDYNHQLLWGFPELPRRDYRTRHDRWRDDEDAIEAWQAGRTGYPVVDAGMRQLQREGYMHNRARMITASFLTKHLYVDWRVGAAWFERWLVDGDVANNRAQWQWTAGTGTDSRPNRMFNPWTQSTKYNGAGYIRRFVEELADLADDEVHEPHTNLAGSSTDYPPPIVDHADARQRFLEARDAG
ncbi:MAG: cryptochrome/photolyase family protein [Actinomycetes bacterium]